MSWVNQLESHLKTDGLEKVPSGWLTSHQISDKLGKAMSTASHMIAEQVRNGRLEMKKFRIQVGDRAVSTPHYRPATKRK